MAASDDEEEDEMQGILRELEEADAAASVGADDDHAEATLFNLAQWVVAPRLQDSSSSNNNNNNNA